MQNTALPPRISAQCWGENFFALFMRGPRKNQHCSNYPSNNISPTKRWKFPFFLPISFHSISFHPKSLDPNIVLAILIHLYYYSLVLVNLMFVSVIIFYFDYVFLIEILSNIAYPILLSTNPSVGFDFCKF